MFIVATVDVHDRELCTSMFVSENVALNHFWPSKEKAKLRYFKVLRVQWLNVKCFTHILTLILLTWRIG